MVLIFAKSPDLQTCKWAISLREMVGLERCLLGTFSMGLVGAMVSCLSYACQVRVFYVESVNSLLCSLKAMYYYAKSDVWILIV